MTTLSTEHINPETGRRKGYKLTAAQKASREATRKANKLAKAMRKDFASFVAAPLSEAEDKAVNAVLDLMLPETDLEEIRDLFMVERDSTELVTTNQDQEMERITTRVHWERLQESYQNAKFNVINQLRRDQHRRLGIKSDLIDIALK